MAGNGKATINEILWQPVTMYIHIYIYICAVSEFLPKTILFSGRESFRNHKHRPLGIASMFKEYKLVNIFFYNYLLRMVLVMHLFTSRRHMQDCHS